MRRPLAGLVLALALLEVAPARAADAAALLVNPATDDVRNDQASPDIVRKHVETTGGPELLFLDVRAVVLANRKVRRHTGASVQKEFQILLREPMAEDVNVWVCGECTRQAGLAIEDRLDGTEVGGKELSELLADPSTNVSSYREAMGDAVRAAAPPAFNRADRAPCPGCR